MVPAHQLILCYFALCFAILGCHTQKNTAHFSNHRAPFVQWEDLDGDPSQFSYLKHISVTALVDFDFDKFKDLSDRGYLPHMTRFWNYSDSSPYHAEFFWNSKTAENLQLDDIQQVTVEKPADSKLYSQLPLSFLPLYFDKKLVVNNQRGCITNYFFKKNQGLKLSSAQLEYLKKGQDELCLHSRKTNQVGEKQRRKDKNIGSEDLPYLYADLVFAAHLSVLSMHQQIQRRPGDIAIFMLPVTQLLPTLHISPNQKSIEAIAKHAATAELYSRVAFSIKLSGLQKATKESPVTFAQLAGFTINGKNLWSSTEKIFHHGTTIFPFRDGKNKKQELPKLIVSQGRLKRSKISLHSGFRTLYQYEKLSPVGGLSFSNEKVILGRELTVEDWLKESYRQSDQHLNAIPAIADLFLKRHNDASDSGVLFFTMKKKHWSRSLFAVTTVNTLNQKALPFNMEKLRVPPTPEILSRLFKTAAKAQTTKPGNISYRETE